MATASVREKSYFVFQHGRHLKVEISETGGHNVNIYDCYIIGRFSVLSKIEDIVERKKLNVNTELRKSPEAPLFSSFLSSPHYSSLHLSSPVFSPALSFLSSPLLL